MLPSDWIEQNRRRAPLFLVCVFLVAGGASPTPAAEAARGGVYSVVELSFQGPPQGPPDAPARDIDFWALFRHESGSPQFKVHGFWDGDGRGGNSGNVFKVRFAPTREGRWNLVKVHSNVPQLAEQKQDAYVTATPSNLRGFWLPDPQSPGRRWYMRSDGSHPYILGNTHYSFLSGYKEENQPSGNDIAADIARNAKYFKKLRFSLHGDRYPDPTEKPFLDEEGNPTDWGDYSHRPNPKWFHERADLAVRTAFEHDLIADLILCGPDMEESRSTLRARRNHGDPAPYLKYIAARYGSYPNVWICVCNEYNIRTPVYTEEQIARFGSILRSFLPYPTPLSNHPSSKPLWAQAFDQLPPWNDHQIVQRKIRELPVAADVIRQVWENPGGKGPRNKPTVNDELSYEGAGDRHTEADTIEAHLGAFLGGGYGTTGYKSGNKLGHYFAANFDPAEHTSADNLKWLREVIDRNITFWKMAPDESVFSNLDPGFRGMGWPGQEYVLGTNRSREAVVAELPPGQWSVKRYDVMSQQETVLRRWAAGRFTFDAPASRAVLFHFSKNRAERAH